MWCSVKMKAFGLSMLWSLAGCTTVFAQSYPRVNITECGLSCLAIVIPQAGCAFTNIECQCKSSILPTLTASCLTANCTMHDELVLAKAQAIECDLPHPNRSREIITYSAVVYSICSVLIALRLISKICVSKTMGIDDWIVIAGQLILVIATVSAIQMAEKGLGRHIWELGEGDLSLVLEHFYIAEISYVVSITLAKISALFLYLRLFQHNTTFRFAAYATIGMMATSTTILFFLTIFMCHPVDYFWNRDIKGGKCMDVRALVYAMSAMSIVQDVLVVVLPLPVLWGLNMGIKKKLGVCCMFLWEVWDNVDVCIWTILELAAAMICVCLPALRILIIHICRPRSSPNVTYTPNTSERTRGNSSPLNGRSRIAGGGSASLSTEALAELEHSLTHDSTEGSDLETGRPPKVPPKVATIRVDKEEGRISH